VVLEGQEEGEARHELMGVYERVEDKEVNGRGVWQAGGGIGRFLFYSQHEMWMVSDREDMEADNGMGFMYVNSSTTTPDQITEQWKASDKTAFVNAPKVRVRVCSSVEKHAAEQRVVQQEEQAMVQAQLSRQLVVEGVANDREQIMGAYELMEGKVVNRRAVWQKGRGFVAERFLYYSSTNTWVVASRQNMEAGSRNCVMTLTTTALTPDQTRPSDVWRVGDAAGFVDAPEVRVQRITGIAVYITTGKR
jgi:hypothetical protein